MTSPGKAYPDQSKGWVVQCSLSSGTPRDGEENNRCIGPRWKAKSICRSLARPHQTHRGRV